MRSSKASGAARSTSSSPCASAAAWARRVFSRWFDALRNSGDPGGVKSAFPKKKDDFHAAVRNRAQEVRRDAAERREGEKASGTALGHLSAHLHRGFLRHLDRGGAAQDQGGREAHRTQGRTHLQGDAGVLADQRARLRTLDRKSTRLNSSHANISYAVFCLKKKNTQAHSINIVTTRV